MQPTELGELYWEIEYNEWQSLHNDGVVTFAYLIY